ncbi:MAG: hypothetical protein IJ130_07905 [Solobacterium sp.]|nr:hypothetical protein [Solobacterium sp.]
MSEYFPDGTLIDSWFYDTSVPSLNELGTQYSLKDYGIRDDGTVQTSAIQALIDRAAENGGGVIVVPEGTWISGSLYFPGNVNLYLEKNAVLKGSEHLRDYPLCTTRIEGQTCTYFPALINVINSDGFRLCGEGTVDGSGQIFWEQFWLRRAWNPECTNKDEQRPRLLYISESSDVIICGITFQNSPFWTTHIYKCDHVKYLRCRMLSPHEDIKGPSTDAIDIDACSDVLVKNCYMAVNDDAVALKGGKGPWADQDPDNGANERIIIEDCEYGFVHGCLTFGSEAIHCRNIILRRIHVSEGYNLLWMKFRPDTPQCYEYVLMEDISGKTANFLNINPWKQFFDLQGRNDLPVSSGTHVTLRNCSFDCDTFFNVKGSGQYHLSDFTLENLEIRAADISFRPDFITDLHCSLIRMEQKDEKEFPDAVTTL